MISTGDLKILITFIYSCVCAHVHVCAHMCVCAYPPHACVWYDLHAVVKKTT